MRSAADLPYALQRPATKLVPVVMPVALAAPLHNLRLGCPDRDNVYDFIVASQLAPLTAMQQLRSLTLRDMDTIRDDLFSTLRHLTALTSLCLATQYDWVQCGVFNAAATLTQLEVLSVDGKWHSDVVDLPAAVSRLTRLRQLEILGVRNLRVGSTLNTLTALERLVILSKNDRHRQPGVISLLPSGVNALRRLRELRVSCGYQPMPLLSLPALEMLQVDAPILAARCAVLAPAH